MNIGIANAAPVDPLPPSSTPTVYAEAKKIVNCLQDQFKKNGAIIWNSTSYEEFKTHIFTADIPECILEKAELERDKHCSGNQLFVLCGDGFDSFTLVNFADQLVRSDKSRTCIQITREDGTGGYFRSAPDYSKALLLLNEDTMDFIKREAPDWQASSIIIVNEKLEIAGAE